MRVPAFTVWQRSALSREPALHASIWVGAPSGSSAAVPSVVRGEFDRRIDPEFGFTARALNMDVRPPFFAREEVKNLNPLTRRTVGLTSSA
jgi:hypothetical protein